MKKVLCFGVFDGLHDGHRSFLRQAKACGDHLIVAVAQDAVIERLKNRKPHFTLAARILALQNARVADEIVPGDLTISDWEVIKKYSPDIITVGYDQHYLRLELETYIKKNMLPIELRVMEQFQKGHPHSSNRA